MTVFATDNERELAGLKQERMTLQGRTSRQYRPELEARLAAVNARIAELEPPRTCDGCRRPRTACAGGELCTSGSAA
jgi:hypothetical protein